MPKSVLKSIQTCFEHVLRQTFRKIFAQFSMEGQVFETFQKNQKICKIPKMPKIVPKSIQTCFEHVLRQTFRKIFAQFSMECRVFENFQKNISSKFQKCPKVFSKVSKRVLNMFWGKLFEKFLPSFPWNVESSKIFKKNIFKIPKMPKSVPKSIQTCFELVLGSNFSKNFYAQCSVEGRVFENFRKKNIFKIPKMPKSVLKSIQTCFDNVLRQTFRKIFAQFSMEGQVFETFQKNQKICKIPKMPKIVPKSIQTCFEHVLRQTFRKIFAQFSMECRVFKNFQKIFFQNSKNAQKCSQMYPNVF